MAACMWACRNPLEGFELHFRKAYQPAIEIQVVPRVGDLPKNVTIQLAGPDKDRFVTTIYTKLFHLTDDGYLYIALDSTASPTPAQPLWVTVVAKAEGFYDVVRPVRVTGQALQSLTVEMVPLTDITVSQNMASADQGGVVTADFTLRGNLPSGNPFSVNIARGNQGKDVVSQTVPGNLTVRSEFVDVSTTAKALAALGLTDTGGIFPLTTQTGPKQTVLAVAGVAVVDVFNQAYQLVKTFERPIQLNFPLSATFYNPFARRIVQVGDRIPVFSYDLATDRWQQETDGLVLPYSGAILACIVSTTHLSTYTAAYTKYPCPAAINFVVQTSVPASDRAYKCELIDDTNGNAIQTFTTTIAESKVIPVSGLESNSFVRLKVYDNQSTAVASSTVVNGCGIEQTQPFVLDLSSFKTPVVVPVIPTPIIPTPTTPITPIPTTPTTPTPTIPTPTTPIIPTPTTPTIPITPVPTTPTTPTPTTPTPTTPAPTIPTPTTPTPTTPAPTTPTPTTPVTPKPTIPTSVTISLQFPCTVIDADKLPGKELYARYRLTGTTKWSALPVLRYIPGKTDFSVEVPTSQLSPGKAYDFEAGTAIGYYVFSQPAYLLEDYTWIIRIKTHEYCKE